MGLATLWPFAYVGLFVYFFASTYGDPSAANGRPEGFEFMLPLHLLTMLGSVALVAGYITHVYRTEQVPTDKKTLWALIIFFGGFIAMPIYWCLYIWSDEPRKEIDPPAASVPRQHRA